MSLLIPLSSKLKTKFKKEYNILEKIPIYSMSDLGRDLKIKKKIIISNIMVNENKFIEKYKLMKYKNDYYCYEDDYVKLLNDLENDIGTLIGIPNEPLDMLEYFTATQLSTRYGLDKMVIGRIAKVKGIKDSDEYCVIRLERSEYLGIYEKTYYTREGVKALDELLLNLSDEEKEMYNQMYGRE